MKFTISNTRFWITAILLLLLSGITETEVASAGAEGRADSPFAIPAFHCLGLYWSPPGGSADKEVLVRYRRQGESPWKEALSMRYNPIPETDEDLTDYRGSIEAHGIRGEPVYAPSAGFASV